MHRRRFDAISALRFNLGQLNEFGSSIACRNSCSATLQLLWIIRELEVIVAEFEDALQVCKPHLDLLALAP